MDGVVLLHGIGRTRAIVSKMQAALERCRLRHAEPRTTRAAARRWKRWRRISIPPSSALPSGIDGSAFISSAIPWAGCLARVYIAGTGHNASGRVVMLGTQWRQRDRRPPEEHRRLPRLVRTGRAATR